MTIEERALKAAGLKERGECNCAQAILSVFNDVLNLDNQTLMELGAGFAAGMGCMESTCGALIAAVMVAGKISAGKGSARLAKTILADFKEKSGALVCGDLKGVKSGKVLCECPQCVYNAVMSLGKISGTDF